MKITTKVFGEITIEDDRIIHFPSGIIGFPELTDFALIHDEEKGAGAIHWLQSVQEPAFAMPVIDPLGDLLTGREEGDKAVPVHLDVAVLPEPLHGHADAGLGQLQLVHHAESGSPPDNPQQIREYS